jgi:hypothetical protein
VKDKIEGLVRSGVEEALLGSQVSERGVNELAPIFRAMDQSVEYFDLDLLRLEYLQGES